MKKILRNISLLALTLVLFTTSFSGFASAKVKTDQESKKVEELAKHLEFIFEEAALKDDNGNVIGFDANKIEEKFGPIPEIEKLKTISNPDEVTIKPMNAAVDRCVEKRLKANMEILLLEQLLVQLSIILVKEIIKWQPKRL